MINPLNYRLRLSLIAENDDIILDDVTGIDLPDEDIERVLAELRDRLMCRVVQ